MAPKRRKSSKPLLTSSFAAKIVSVSSFSHGSVIISASVSGFLYESKSQTMRSGFTPREFICLSPQSQKTI